MVYKYIFSPSYLSHPPQKSIDKKTNSSAQKEGCCLNERDQKTRERHRLPQGGYDKSASTYAQTLQEKLRYFRKNYAQVHKAYAPST